MVEENVPFKRNVPIALNVKSGGPSR